MKKFVAMFLIAVLLGAFAKPEISFSSNLPSAAITPAQYQKMLGKGVDVSWAQFKKEIENYSKKEPEDFKKMGFSHVRIRVSSDATPDFLARLDRVVNDCLNVGLIPIIAYQGGYFEENPTPENMQKVTDWWTKVAEHYKNYPPLLSFDILIEVSGKLSKEPQTLNELYEKVVSAIRKTNPTRIIFISPVNRSDPDDLKELEIPSKADGYLMAEWHFYAAGPSKTNPRKKWTTGTADEKKLITDKINTALAWQRKTGILTWVGAWMPGDYNHGNHYTVSEQIPFASFMSSSLDIAGIPFAVNSDSKFYDIENKKWIQSMLPVVRAILHPLCKIDMELQPGNPFMLANDIKKEIDPGRGTTPVIIPEWRRTVVPIRAIVETLGGTIEWDGKERKVTILFNDTKIELRIGKPQAMVNGRKKWIDENNHNVKPIIINGRTMLPLRFVAESLGCEVNWDPNTRTITITYTPG